MEADPEKAKAHSLQPARAGLEGEVTRPIAVTLTGYLASWGWIIFIFEKATQ